MKKYKVDDGVKRIYRHACAVWAVAVDDVIVAAVDMSDHGGAYTGREPKIISLAKRKKFCQASMTVAKKINREIFLAHRLASRSALEALARLRGGQVLSGALSQKFGDVFFITKGGQP